MDEDLLRDRFTGQAMNSLHNVGVLLVAAALIGAIGSTTSLLQNQASAQGVIVPEREEQFNKLSERFQQDVSDLVAGDPPSEDNAGDPPSEDNAVDPPDPDKLAALFDNYKKETFRLFELEPPDPDSPTKGDPPTEVDPPDPDLSR